MSDDKFQTAAFGMGCFWGLDALLGAQEGVIKTRVGYAGGTKENPTYAKIGDHTETILIEFDPEMIHYPSLLKLFWDNHHYNTEGKKNQYASRIFYINEDQQRQAEKSKSEKERQEKVATKIQPLNFTVAEDYHQKYRLRHSKFMNNFKDLNASEFRDSPLAAKLNGYTAGHLSLEDLEKFDLETEPGLKDRLLNSTRKLL